MSRTAWYDVLTTTGLERFTMSKPDTPETPETPATVNDLDALANHDVFSPSGIEVPDQVKAWVESGYEHWQKFPAQWRHVILSSETAATEILTQARHYAGELREERLSIQTRKEGTGGVPEGWRLVYRVRTRVGAGRPAAARAATPGAEATPDVTA
jgi:hypothetical protein